MRIILEENDSFIQPDGQATMIVVAVTKDDGKTVRFPYSAGKTMSALIQDINLKLGSATTSDRKIELPVITYEQERPTPMGKTDDGKIQREDLVKVVKLLPRDEKAPKDLEIGQIYRVLALPTNKQPYYEVIDDTDYHKAEIPRRVAAYPEEIVFFHKRKSPVQKKVGSFEQIMPCELCKKNIVGYKTDDNKYHAICSDCNHETVV